MKKSFSLLEVRRPIPGRRQNVSPATLSQFLIKTADLLTTAGTGNAALAEALKELAKDVRRKTIAGDPRNGPSSDRPQRVVLSDEFLRLLTAREVESFIEDEGKTKDELIDLASARFSMPRSQLKRMKVIEVRETISSALHHESSIEILAQEARKDGATRKS